VEIAQTPGGPAHRSRTHADERRRVGATCRRPDRWPAG